MKDDLRVIEDYLPIRAISAEASREKTLRTGNISTLHLWWARRPLTGCRAIVYGSLVPVDRFRPNSGPKNKRASVSRGNAAKFVERLCTTDASLRDVSEARQHILDAHAQRLTAELANARSAGKKPAWVEEFGFAAGKVTVEDIEQGRAPRPRVLDMFAGGGAIPLEALRLGCEAHALDLNPLAHMIELCTLVYAQKYGKPDPSSAGMTGSADSRGRSTWGGLSEEVRHWGNWLLEQMRAELSDLYPVIRTSSSGGVGRRQSTFAFAEGEPPKTKNATGCLTPVAYLWTRTVRCKKPTCGGTVPLVRQTWLRRKKGRYAVLKMIPNARNKALRFEVVEARTEEGLGFDPAAFSTAGNATCPFCGTVADAEYVTREGIAERMGVLPMAVVATSKRGQGKRYYPVNGTRLFDAEGVQSRLQQLLRDSGLQVPETRIQEWSGVINPPLHGLSKYKLLFNPRQLLVMLSTVYHLRHAYSLMLDHGTYPDRALAVLCFVATFLDQLADWNSSLATWISKGEKISDGLAGPGVGMTWDFAEINPLADGSGALKPKLKRVCDAIDAIAAVGEPAKVDRGNATSLMMPDGWYDCVLTDPPYYWNLPYSHLSDFVYVWLRLVFGDLLPEHFSTETTPKKKEAIASAVRDGDRAGAVYKEFMTRAFAEAHRVLRDGGMMVCVYAHRTTAGWATLVESIRKPGFTVVEAWPVEMEKKGRPIAIEAAALKSNVLLVARKRNVKGGVGSYGEDVQPELDRLVRERVSALWNAGVAGGDLVIAAVGAALRAFTRFGRVEYANGEEMPPEKLLAEVEAVVLDNLMARIAGEVGSGVSAVDPPSRFYALWRYVYKTAEIEAGEAIVFTYSQDVELDGAEGLSTGRDHLLQKEKGKYRLCDYTERGEIEDLGHPWEDGTPAPLIDVLHRTLWLMDNQPRSLREYLDEVAPNREQLRLLAAALAGPGLSGKSDEDAQRLLATTADEQSALGKLLSNWKALVPDSLFDAGKR